jgi:hypothetical protein
MFKRLFYTELESNRTFLLLALAINVFLFFFMGYREQELLAFVGSSLFSFWILLIVMASTSSHEKRTRLYTQLPVTSRQIFCAGWALVLAWLALQVLVWIIFGLVYTEDFSAVVIGEMLTFAIGAALFVVVISIGIDLGAFRPAYLRWLYIAVLVFLLVMAGVTETWIGLIGNDERFGFYPMALLDDLSLELMLSTILLVLVLLLDYLVFRFSDNYLE